MKASAAELINIKYKISIKTQPLSRRTVFCVKKIQNFNEYEKLLPRDAF